MNVAATMPCTRSGTGGASAMVRPTMVASNGKKSIAPTGTSSTQELIFKWFVATSLSQNGYGVAEQDLCRQLLRGISEMAEDVQEGHSWC